MHVSFIDQCLYTVLMSNYLYLKLNLFPVLYADTALIQIFNFDDRLRTCPLFHFHSALDLFILNS